MPNVAIIGAGPAGLFAAEILARHGLNVHVYDQKPSPARKFLMAGRGGLNITHSENIAAFISRYGPASEFLRPALQQFSPQDMRDWCANLGEETFIGTSGRVFPKSFKASPLLRAWLGRLDKSGVTFHFNHVWKGFPGDSQVQFSSPDGDVNISADAVLLALGGASWPRLGSDGHWVDTLTTRGIKITPFAPTNCGFHVAWSDIFKNKHAGMPLKSIALTYNDQTIRGEVIITTNGIEGGGIYPLSSHVRRDLGEKSPVTLYLDLKPDMTTDHLTDLLSKPSGRDTFTNYLRKATGLSPVAIGLLQEDRNLKNLSPQKRAAIIKHFPVQLIAPFPIDRAISSAGGIVLDEINPNYMLKKCPRVFVAGEMLDWEAPTGGYLLQASFATAHVAANGILTLLGS